MPPKKKPPPKEQCCVCCQPIAKDKDEGLFCAGECQQRLHRYCAGLSKPCYKSIIEKGTPFFCFACCLARHRIEIDALKDTVEHLKGEIADLKSSPPSSKVLKDPQVVTAPVAAPKSYASTVNTGSGESNKESHTNSNSESRKFNVVIYGIGECRQGARWPERLTHDISKAESTLADIDGSLKSGSIKDCYRLGKFRPNQERPRPMLVKFVRIEDVSKILANRRATKPPIVIKPDMTREERIRESTLLRQRWNLISSGVPKHAIKIARSKIYVNNAVHGTYSPSGFVLASNSASQQNAPINKPPSNHGSVSLSNSTSSVLPLSATPTSDKQPTISETMPHSTPLCQFPTSQDTHVSHSTRATSSPPCNEENAPKATGLPPCMD